MKSSRIKFPKFTGKKLCSGVLFLIILQACACIVTKNKTPLRLLSSEFEIFQNIYLRSNLSQMLIRIGILKNFTIFTGKHSCWGLVLIKLNRPAALLKRDCNTDVFLWIMQHRCFFVNNATQMFFSE